MFEGIGVEAFESEDIETIDRRSHNIVVVVVAAALIAINNTKILIVIDVGHLDNNGLIDTFDNIIEQSMIQRFREGIPCVSGLYWCQLYFT